MTPASEPPRESPVVLDGGTLTCARLLVKLRNLVATLEPGTLVHLVARDPVAPIDLPAWCHLTGHHYLGPVPSAAADGAPTFAVEVRAEARATDPARPWHVAQ